MRLDPKKRDAIAHLLIMDLFSVVVAWLLFVVYEQHFLRHTDYNTVFSNFSPKDAVIVLGVALIWMFVYWVSGTYFDLYRKSRFHEIIRTLISCVIGVAVVFAVVIYHSFPVGTNSLSICISYFLIQTSCSLLFRLLILYRVKRNLVTGRVGFNTLIIGGNEKAIDVYKEVLNNPKVLGNIFKGFIYSSKEAGNGMNKHLPQLGHLSELESIIDTHEIEEVIIAVDSSEHHLLENIVTRLCYRPVVMKVLPDYYDIISGSVKTSNVYDAVLIHIHPDLMPDWQRVCKRLLDILISASALVAISPLLLFTAIMVKLSSKGGILYRQERVGLFGRPFTILKFRSMYTDAEKTGPALSSKEDPRITPWGRFMRKWRIDELPQFWNIIRGDMSLVGPRPERKHYIDIISQKHPHYKYLHKVKPGLTSWGMVQFGYAESVEEMIERMKYDLLYIENCSLALDIKIILYTFLVLVQGRGK
jgi:polysaccharide biosynthesis protein PslA